MNQTRRVRQGSALNAIQIPDKTYFKIGEVAKLLDLQPYVLRYWETEFDLLDPEKTKTGQRAYRRDDIELLLLVKTLLYDEMYTIAGARRQLKLRRKGAIEPLGPEAQQRLVTAHDALQQERTEWITERERLTAAAEKHREEAARLRIQNETLEDENAQLAAAQLDYENSIHRLRDEVTERRQATVVLEQRVEELSDGAAGRDDAAQLQVQNAESVERIARLERERDAAASAREAMSAELAASAARLQELDAALAGAQRAVAAANEELAHLGSELESMEADLASAESEIERLESEKAKLAERAADSSKVSALEAQLADALTQVEALRTERDRAAKRRDEADERQRGQFTLLRRELETLAALVH